MIEKMVNQINLSNNYRRRDMGDYTQRLKVLTETHRFLNKQVDKLEKTGNFKDEELAQMKKQRLNLKDQIDRLQKVNAE